MNPRNRVAVALLGLLLAGISPLFSAAEPEREEFLFWLDLARAGDPEGQFRTANRYRDGLGVAADLAEALRWYRLSARQGFAKAENNLGLMYARGLGVPRDETEATEWYRRAAERGLAVAQFNLGSMYASGRGVGKDATEALNWLERAAAQGYAEAQYRAGLQHAEGLGTAVDPERAFSWFLKAARQDHPAAQRRVGRAYAEGLGVAPNAKKSRKWLGRVSPGAPPPIEPVEATQTAVAEDPVETPTGATEDVASGTVESGSREGDTTEPEAQYRIARSYAMGQGVPRDLVRAGEWYRRAAEQGHLLSWYRLGFQSMDGKGVSKRRDYAQAHMWFSLCADRGVGDAERWRDTLAAKMTASELSESLERQKTWNTRFPIKRNDNE